MRLPDLDPFRALPSEIIENAPFPYPSSGTNVRDVKAGPFLRSQRSVEVQFSEIGFRTISLK